MDKHCIEMQQSETSLDLTLSTSPRKKAGVMAQQVLDEMVLYDGNTEMGYSLNASARSIWDLCDGERSLEAICDEIAKDLDIQADLLHEDVKTTVKDLMELGLLKVGAQENTSQLGEAAV